MVEGWGCWYGVSREPQQPVQGNDAVARVINSPNTPMRLAPSTDSAVYRRVYRGEKIRIRVLDYISWAMWLEFLFQVLLWKHHTFEDNSLELMA